MENLSREQALACLFAGVVVIYVVLCFIKRLKTSIKVLLAVVVLVVLFTGGGIINLNYLPSDVKKKVESVVDRVGDTFIKAEGNTVYVKVNDEWMDVGKIKVIGDFVNDNTISYEGHDVYLGHSGVFNTIKVLQDVGLIGK